MVRPADVVETVSDRLWPLFMAERDRLREVDRWYRWDHPPNHVPHGASTEHKRLIELSRTPWLGLVVSVISQTMFVDGFKSPDDGTESAAWRTWLGNGMAAKQIPIHRAMLAYGYSFGIALPGVGPDGSPMANLTAASPLSMQAVYGDPAEDEWPLFAMRVIPQGDRVAIRFYDEEAVHFLSADRGGSRVEYIEPRPHNAGVCPVVRYSNQLDLEGRTPGEVEPFIPVAARINKTDYDRMLTQHFASWKIRYATGMAKPDDADEAAATKMRLRQEDFLIAEDPDTKFGTLDATALDGFIAAHKSDVEALAAVSQTPTNALTGDMVNLSAEALASARAQLDQKVGERKVSAGQSHAQLLRLGAFIEGDVAAAADFLSRITWQDNSIRSIAQAVDALGKAAQMLQVPVRALWPMIPGVTKSDVDDWAGMAAGDDPFAKLDARLAAQAEAVASAPPAA